MTVGLEWQDEKPAKLGWALRLPFGASQAAGRRTGWKCWAALPWPTRRASRREPELLLLLGPKEPGFWAHLKSQPEWDGAPDPVDRWSRRVIGCIACDLGAKALFPFGGPPYHPYYQWALRTGRVWDSPVRLLVHAGQGLMVSFRGALALKEAVVCLPPAVKPCDDLRRRLALSPARRARSPKRAMTCRAATAFLTSRKGPTACPAAALCAALARCRKAMQDCRNSRPITWGNSTDEAVDPDAACKILLGRSADPRP
jgi:hypothetical protein